MRSFVRGLKSLGGLAANRDLAQGAGAATERMSKSRFWAAANILLSSCIDCMYINMSFGGMPPVVSGATAPSPSSGHVSKDS